MIYEFRTYDLKPRALPEVLKLVGEAYPARSKLSPMAAYWYTEIGPLNQVIHVWPYKDLNERARLREESTKIPGWPPKVQDYLLKMQSEIFIPFPFSPELKPGKLGPVFEMRSYFVKAGGMPGQIERWGKQLDKRTAISPLAFVGHTELGPLNKFIHIWPYPSFDERMRIRKHAVDTGAWPPPGGGDNLVSQENKIMLPAPFSPLQ
jgi:hypothetical protein